MKKRAGSRAIQGIEGNWVTSDRGGRIDWLQILRKRRSLIGRFRLRFWQRRGGYLRERLQVQSVLLQCHLRRPT